MKPIFDEDFAGAHGLIKVWNNTYGYLDVSEEGHLLEGQKSAWVEETTKIIDLLESGELIGIGGYQNKDLEASVKASPKKKIQDSGRKRDQRISFSPRSSSCCPRNW